MQIMQRDGEVIVLRSPHDVGEVVISSIAEGLMFGDDAITTLSSKIWFFFWRCEACTWKHCVIISLEGEAGVTE